MLNMIAVELKNISFKYSNSAVKVLDNVNMSVEYGKITLIAGTSGSGKSTLFHIMNGVIPNAITGELVGEVYINGKPTKGQSIGQISSSVGSVLQNAESQIINAKVKDEIAFGLENTAVPSEDMFAIVDKACLDMELDKDSNTATLSGGEKQRLITATTLALKAKIIILDEPLANLDKISGDSLMEKLSLLAKSGYAIVLIEHRLDMVERYIDELYSVSKGVVRSEKNIASYLKASTAKIEDSAVINDCKQIAISLKDVSKSIKNKTILHNTTIDIHKGERIVILGDNGAGKSTLTKLLLRLIKPSSGKVTQSLDEKIGQKANKKWFKKVAYVFQNPNYQLFMPTVEEELLFSAHSLEYCQKIVDLFEIEDLLDRHPQSLSEGQKRKVGVATMLAMRPEVIVLDEPTVGQDYNSLNRLVNIINQIHKEEATTVVTITHDIRCAEALCSSAWIVDGGRLIKTGGKELVKDYFSTKNLQK